MASATKKQARGVQRDCEGELSSDDDEKKKEAPGSIAYEGGGRQLVGRLTVLKGGRKPTPGTRVESPLRWPKGHGDRAKKHTSREDLVECQLWSQGCCGLE